MAFGVNAASQAKRPAGLSPASPDIQRPIGGFQYIRGNPKIDGSRAFSSEVGTGSREENASKQNARARF